MNIIYLENDPMAWKTLREGVQLDLKGKYEIHFVEDRKKLESFLSENSPEFALLDINLQNGPQEGLEIAEALIPQYPLIKFLMISSYTNFEYLSKARVIGCRGYIDKAEVAESFFELDKALSFAFSESPDAFYLSHNLKEEIVNYHLDLFAEKNHLPSKPDNLPVPNPQQKELLEYYASGYQRQEIISLMDLDGHAVDRIKDSLISLFNIQLENGQRPKESALVAFAVKYNLIELPF